MVVSSNHFRSERYRQLFSVALTGQKQTIRGGSMGNPIGRYVTQHDASRYRASSGCLTNGETVRTSLFTKNLMLLYEIFHNTPVFSMHSYHTVAYKSVPVLSHNIPFFQFAVVVARDLQSLCEVILVVSYGTVLDRY